MVDRLLVEDRAAAVGLLDPELEPGLPGHSHLGAQAQQVARLEALDPPPVQRVADGEPVGVAASAAQSGPTDEAVHQPARDPSQAPGVPAAPSADALDDVPQGVGVGIDMALPLVTADDAAGPLGILGQRRGGRPGRRRRVPGGGDVELADAGQGQLDRAVHPGQAVLGGGHEAAQVGLGGDRFMDQGLDQRASDSGGHGGDQTDPVAGQPRGQHRHGTDPAAGEPGGACIGVQQLGEGQHVGASDVECAVRRALEPGRADEVVQHVAHGDRLDPVAHPARGHHHRQTLGEMPHDLEGCAAGAEDHGRAQHHRGDLTAQQDLPDLLAGGHVRGELLALGMDAAEVDDPPHVGVLRGGGEGARTLPVALGEAATPAHGVDQVVGDVDPVQRGLQARRILDVGLHHLDLCAPGAVLEPVGVARHRAHPQSGGQQRGDQAPADVSAGAGDQDERGIGRRREIGAHAGSPSWARCWARGASAGAVAGRVRSAARRISAVARSREATSSGGRS